MKTIDEVLNDVTEADDGAMIVRPATKKDLKLCNKDLTEMEFPLLPQGYCDFLSKLNGFAWNGMEFYSTDQVTDTDTGFMLNDIVSANERFFERNDVEIYPALKGCILLGSGGEDLYIYNTQIEKYEVLDLSGRDVMVEYETFEALFYGEVWQAI